MESGGLPSSFGLLAAASLLLVLLVAAMWVLRRQARGVGWWRPASRRLELLEVRALGPRHRVVLMRVDGREVLIGVSPGQVNLIDCWMTGPPDAPPPCEDTSSAKERP